MANNQANIKAVITAEDKASAVVKGFGTNVDKTSKDVTHSLNTSALAVAAASAGIVAFGKKSLDAFNAQDVATARLEAGIKNVKSATDKNIDSLLKQAAALQKTTRFSDEAYISAQGILTTFQLNQKAIEKLTPRLADMSEGLARVNGGLPDMEGNAILVAKAIGGEDTEGLTGALRRVGVIMTKTQEELLKTGTVEQRVALVTEILDQNFQGLAVAAGETTAGKLAILRNQFGELQEKVGETIATALTPMLNILNAHPAILTTATVALGGLAAAFVAVKVAAAIGTTIQGVTVALGAMSSAAATATAAMTTLSAVSIAGWAAVTVGSLYAVVSAANAVKGAFDAVFAAEQAANSLGSDAQVRKLQQQAADARRRGDTAAVNRYSNAIAALGGGRASGGPVMAGVPYTVGEQGRETFVPSQNGTIIDANKSKGLTGASTINLSVNVGVYTGSEIEKRKLAQMLLDAMRDLAGGNNMTLGEMIK